MGDFVLKARRRAAVFAILAILATGAVSGCASTGPRGSRKEAAAPKGRDASYYYLLAEMETRRNRPAKALAYVEESIEKDPDSPRLWYKKAFLEAALGDLKKAEEDVRQSLAFDPDDRDANVLLGKICQSQDRRAEAISAYKKALRPDPVLPPSEEANVLLIETYVADKQPGAALSLTQSWQRQDADNVLPVFYEAWLYQNFIKNAAKAVAAYERVIEIDPSNVKALSALAEIYVERKDEKKALETFGRLESLAPGDANLKLKTAIIYYEQKQYDRAVEKFRDVLREYPGDERIIYYMGVIEENLKHDDEARAEFEKILPASTFYKDARLHMAFLKLRKGDAAGAQEIMEDAIRRKPAVGPFYEYLAEIHRDRGEYGPAIDVLRRGLKKSPEKESLWYNLGMAYDKAGRFPDMVSAMREVLKLNPQNASALNYLGYSYADRGENLDEALELLKKAVALKPGDGFITDSLGWVHFRRGEWELALSAIQRAYGMVPNEPTITEHLGDVWLKKGDRGKALKYFREAAALLQKKGKDDAEAAKELERVRQKISGLGA
ncbi:MAG TPA: tetratricopeptide repeat protein [bacterium]|nr:tetratricopeptide repeat protein [bacterium]